MRVYLPAGLDDLRRLAGGQAVQIDGYLAASTDEEDELAALETAGEEAPAVVVAEVSDPDAPVSLVDVEALHAVTDDSGDLAWFATQEIATVVEVLER
jgi:hypothetical protein